MRRFYWRNETEDSQRRLEEAEQREQEAEWTWPVLCVREWRGAEGRDRVSRVGRAGAQKSEIS